MGCILKTIGRMEKTNVDDGSEKLIEKIINLLPVSDLKDLDKVEEVLADENACSQMVRKISVV